MTKKEKNVGEKIEVTLSHPVTRSIFRLVSRKNGRDDSLIGRAFTAYCRDKLSIGEQIKYGWLFSIMDRLFKKWGVDKKIVQEKALGHQPTRRALVNTIRSIGRFGLTHPQKFTAPLMVVWNYTNLCNLECIHCYQDAEHKPLPDELSFEEKIDVVDQMADSDVVLLAFSGGEPLMREDFWDVAKHAHDRKLHLTVATNGTLLNEKNINRLAEVGVKYVEVSLDSLNPETHNKFRGAGCWEKTVQGIKNVVRLSKVRVGIASTITRVNFHELEKLIEFSKDLGCHKFCAFNFVPTGRGKEIVNLDLTPKMRDEMLEILYRHLDEGKIDIMTTSPQISRTCMETSFLYGGVGSMATGHIAAGKGESVKLFAKYLGGCGAGRCYCCLQPNGVVTPCVFMPLPVGDIRKEKFIDIWNNCEVFKTLQDRDDRKGECSKCDYRYYCGGCRARPYGYFEDIRESDPGCSRNESLFNELVSYGARRAT